MAGLRYSSRKKGEEKETNPSAQSKQFRYCDIHILCYFDIMLSILSFYVKENIDWYAKSQLHFKEIQM